MTRRESYIPAFAIVRRDHFPGHECRPDDSDPPDICGGEYSFRVKEVVLDEAAAIREVERLNALKADSSVRYFWQYTHLFPDGGSHGQEPS